MRRTSFTILLLAGILVLGCGRDDTLELPPGINVSGEDITVVQGQSATATVLVGRVGGFSSAVNLAASDLPTGVTASFDPATIPAGIGAGTSTMTLAAAADAVTGPATYLVTATATGVPDARYMGTVTVNAANPIASPSAGTGQRKR